MRYILDLHKDPSRTAQLRDLLAGDYEVVGHAGSGSIFDEIEHHKPVAVLVDLDEDPDGGLEAISAVCAAASAPPVIAVGSGADPGLVVRAVRLGAFDCLARPLATAALRTVLARATKPLPAFPFLGESPAIRKASDLMARYAACDYPVLILGESGTGKELAARAIHDLSARREGAYVTRNCAAFPTELIESELFGTARGAFTGATERPGAFELAQGGTLFLDELGEASPAVQAKLLRALEAGEVWRLADRRARRTDVRFISATSLDTEAALAEGRLRRDLIYRINTLVLKLPPLRERREDILGLAEFFLLAAVGSRKYFAPGAYARLVDHPWPGNVRQLKNVVHRATILAGEREEIGEDDLVFF